MVRRAKYPSDISREQFESIMPLLESACKKTDTRTVDLYEVFCAVLYLLKSGCQWRMLPSDFPKWCIVHHYLSLWSLKPEGGTSLLEQGLKISSWCGPYQISVQQRHGANIRGIDAQSVNTNGYAGDRCYALVMKYQVINGKFSLIRKVCRMRSSKQRWMLSTYAKPIL
jgi:transposase